MLSNGKLHFYLGDGENFSSNYMPRNAEPAVSKVLFSTTPANITLFTQDTNDDTYRDVIIVEPGKRIYTLEWDIILNDFKIPHLTEIPMMNTSSLGYNNYELPGFSWFACNDINKSCGITKFTIGTHPVAVEEEDDDDW